MTKPIGSLVVKAILLSAAGVNPIGISLPTIFDISLAHDKTPSIALSTSILASIRGLPPSAAINIERSSNSSRIIDEAL